MSKAISQILDGIRILDVTDSTYENVELQEYKRYIKFFHKWIVKPISFWGSTRILRRELLKALGDIKNKKIIDVSCGDDEVIFQLAKKAKLVVANDISEIAVAPLLQPARRFKNIKFYIQNIVDLKGEYDIVICKNTLHHMNTINQVEKALKVLKALGDRIIIMDIENPKSQLRSYLWNLYYKIALKDQGKFFITFEQFIQAIRVIFLNAKIHFKKINTIKGTYMLAVIENN